MKLHNKKAIITGASQGLGACIAEHFVKEGATIFLCARNLDALEKVKSDLEPQLADGQSIYIKSCDVSDTKSVDGMVTEAAGKMGDIDILVNNAGVYGPFGLIEDIDWDEWVESININLMGTVYPSRAVLPYLRKKKYGKIVNLSGGGATNPLPRISSYAASKAAVVRLVETLALETKDDNIDVNAIAPGALATRLNKDLLDAGPEVIGEQFYERMKGIMEKGGTPLEKGAKLAVYLASGDSDGITGKLISAQWDPWADFQKHKDDLDGGDIYTIRRITPKERGKDWGDV